MLASNANWYRKTTSPSEFLCQLAVGEEHYCRYLWSKAINKDDGAWRAIGHRESGKPVTTLADFVIRAEKYIPARNSVSCSVDVFFSPNEFFDWRCAPQLAFLRSSWLEIDTAGHEAVTPEVESEILEQALFQLKAAGVPPPTGGVFSGSGGVHLYWIYDKPVEAYRWRVNTWRQIAEKLSSSLPGGKTWHVDCSASHDPARVLRLPGSIHGGTGRIVHSFLGGGRIAFEDLAEALSVSHAKPKPKSTLVQNDAEKGEGSLKHRPEPAVIVQGSKPRKHTIAQWWAKVYFAVVSHARQHGVSEGQRDLTAFILYVALKHIKPDEERAFEEVLKLNEEFIGLDAKQLTGYLSTARRTHYKFSKSTLAKYLSSIGIDPDFLYIPSPAVLSPEQVKQRQRQAASDTASQKRVKTMAIINAVIPNLARVTQAALAEAAGISDRTVRRYWHQIKQVIRSPSIYSPPLMECPV